MSDNLQDVIDLLEQAVFSGEIERPSFEFAHFISNLECTCKGEKHPLFFIASCLLFHAVEAGNTCLLLDGKWLKGLVHSIGSDKLIESLNTLFIHASTNDSIDWSLVANELEKILKNANTVGMADTIKEDNISLPLIFDRNRLYIQRFFSYEQKLAHMMRLMAQLPPSFFAEDHKKQEKGIRAAVEMANKLFKSDSDDPDWQKIASLIGILGRIVVISGGPGTGKTRTVTGLTAVMQAASFAVTGNALNVAFCAPTGKAAARLSESVAKAKTSLDLPDKIAQVIPSQAQTLHRLLGAGRTPGRFRFGPKKPLPFDLVVLDEASMVDLPMMTHLMESVFPDTTIVIIGDKDQLASVEAGSVLGDVSHGIEVGDYSDEFRRLMKKAKENLPSSVKKSLCKSQQSLRDSIVELERNYRFSKSSDLYRFSKAINQGDENDAIQILMSKKPPATTQETVEIISSNKYGLDTLIKMHIDPWLDELLKASNPEEGLKCLGKLKVLCTLKKGPRGVEFINSFITQHIQKRINLFPQKGPFQPMPIIINQNDYMTDLFNGDTGIFWRRTNGEIAAWFEDGDGGIRSISHYQLPPFDPAWAITVHRSQGSEYEKVIVILPPASSPLATREMLYTAVTRARKKVILWGTKEELKTCIKTDTKRASGLKEFLWS